MVRSLQQVETKETGESCYLVLIRVFSNSGSPGFLKADIFVLRIDLSARKTEGALVPAAGRQPSLSAGSCWRGSP